MKTKEEMLESNHINSDDGAMYTGLIKKSMQEFADQECVSFAEWISNNLKWQKKTKRDLWLNNETLKVVTTAELLTIYKNIHNGK